MVSKKGFSDNVTSVETYKKWSFEIFGGICLAYSRKAQRLVWPEWSEVGDSNRRKIIRLHMYL